MALSAERAKISELEQERVEVLAELEPIRASIESLQLELSEAGNMVSELQEALELCQGEG